MRSSSWEKFAPENYGKKIQELKQPSCLKDPEQELDY